MKNNTILGIKFDDFKSKKDFIKKISNEFQKSKKQKSSKIACYLNTHAINNACRNREYKRILSNADICLIDGVGLKLASNFIAGTTISCTLTPPVWMHDFFRTIPSKTKLFFVGDTEEIINQYSQSVAHEFPQLKVVGNHHGFFLNDSNSENYLIESIKSTNPDIVIVGMGMPIQELWIEKIKHKTRVPLFIPVGAYYRRMLGLEKRPPLFISNMGLEWFYRFLYNPKKLFKRYIIGNPLFIYRLIKHTIMVRNESKKSTYKV